MQHDDEITSAEFDDAETLGSERAVGGTEVRLYVAVDPATLHELEQRAAAEGTDLTVVAADVLRAGTEAA